jgi:perosamine synthetase
MNDLSASIGLAQLKKLDRMNAERSRHIKRYLDGIKSLVHIKPLLPFEPDKNSYWLFGVRCDKRDELILHLKSKGIATGVHYMPLMLFPYFKKWDNGCERSKRIWNSFITLPLFVDLRNKEIDYVINALIDFDKNF